LAFDITFAWPPCSGGALNPTGRCQPRRTAPSAFDKSGKQSCRQAPGERLSYAGL